MKPLSWLYHGIILYYFSMNVDNHNRGSSIYFKSIGLGGSDYINDKNWAMMSLASIIKKNGHQQVRTHIILKTKLLSTIAFYNYALLLCV